MISISENVVIINGITEEPWQELVDQAMTRREEIILVLQETPEAEVEQLNALTDRQGYSPPDTLTEEQWAKLKPKLNLTPFGAKEQGINRNLIYWIRPLDQPEAME